MIRILDYRLRRGLTQKELGQLVGVTESAVALWENGKRKPNYERLLKLSEALDCSVNDLVDYTANYEDLDLKDMPEITMIARAGAKMTPEKRQDMLKILKTIYPEEFSV